LSEFNEVLNHKVRFEKLDLMRGIAAIFVLALHVPGTPNVFFGFGYLWVDFFFVLSGFVLQPGLSAIGSLSQKRSRILFLKQRFIRLFPITWIGLTLILMKSLVIACFVRVFHLQNIDNPLTTGRNLYSFLAAMLLFQFFVPASLHWIGALWSLSLEWIINIFATILPVAKYSIVSLCQAVFGIALVGVSDFLLTSKSHYYWIHDLGRGIAGFALGCLIRNLRKQFDLNFKFILPITLFLVSLIWTTWKFSPVWSWYVSMPIFAFLVFALSSQNLNGESRYSNLYQFIGNQSFGIYVYHSVCIGSLIFIMRTLEFSICWELNLTLVMILTVALAVFSRKLIEPRITRSLRRALRVI